MTIKEFALIFENLVANTPKSPIQDGCHRSFSKRIYALGHGVLYTWRGNWILKVTQCMANCQN